MNSSDSDYLSHDLATVLQDLKLPAHADLATIKRTYLNLAYAVHPKLLKANDSVSLRKFEKLTDSCYKAIIRRGVCGRCFNQNCRECQANFDVTANFDHVRFDHEGVDTKHQFEILYYDLLEEHARHYRYLPKKKRDKHTSSVDDQKLFDFLDYLAKVTITDCPICKDCPECKKENAHLKDNCKTLEGGKAEPEEDCKNNRQENDTFKPKKSRRHRSRQKLRSKHSSADQKSESFIDMYDPSKEEQELLRVNKEARRKKENQALTKRKKELESIRNELLKKCKLAEEKEIKKPHIVLPREIIPKNIKKEIERQQKEAERKKRDFDRRMREEEAKALKLEKRRRKAEKRKQPVKFEVSMENSSTDMNNSSMNDNMPIISTKPSSMEHDVSRSNERIEKTSFLERHLEAYHQLMKEQPKRHTTQQLEEERRRLQEAAAHKQQQELNRLRTQSLTQKSVVSENDRQALLEKLREKERQRNMEEMDICQIKRAKSTEVPQSYSIRAASSNQKRAGRGRGRLHKNLNTNVKIGSKAVDPAFNVKRESRNTDKGMNFNTCVRKAGDSLKHFPSPIYNENGLPSDQNSPLSQVDCNLLKKNAEPMSSKESVVSGFQRFSYSECLKKPTVVKNESLGVKNSGMEDVTSQPKPLQTNVCVRPKTCTFTSMQGSTNQTSRLWNQINASSSEIEHFYRQPTGEIDKTLLKEPKTIGNDPTNSSFNKNFWSSNNSGEDALVPPLTIDEWVRSRKAGSKKNIGSNSSLVTHNSFSTSFSSGWSSSNNSMSHLDASSSCPGTEENSTTLGDIVEAKAKATEVSNSDTSKLKRFFDLKETGRQVEKPVSSQNTASSCKENDDSLAKLIDQISLSESQPSVPKNQSQVGSVPGIEKTHEAMKEFQNQNQILNSSSESENKWLSGTFPSFSFPTGVYPSNDVRQIALNLQQQQQLMQMSINLQTSMMMLAAQAASKTAQSSTCPMQDSATSLIIAPFSLPSSVDSSGSNSASSVFNAKKSNLISSDAVTSAIHSNVKKTGCLNKSVLDNQALSHEAKDAKIKRAKQYSDKEIETILAKFSNVSFEKKPFVRGQDKYSCGLKENQEGFYCTSKSDIELLPEEEENWDEGINLARAWLPHPKRKKSMLSYSEIHSSPQVELKSSDENIYLISKQVPDLISLPSILQPKNSSISKKENVPAHLKRPLRRPFTAMRCKQKANIPKNEINLPKAHSESRNQYSEPSQGLSGSSRTETMASKSMSGHADQELKADKKQPEVVKLENPEGLKSENRNEYSRKKPENPARLMKTAISQMTKGCLSPRYNTRLLNENTLARNIDASTLCNYQASQSKSGFGTDVPKSKSLQTMPAHQTLLSDAELDKSEYIVVPKKSISIPRKPSAFALNNVLGIPQSDVKPQPSCISKVDASENSSASPLAFSLPTMPSLSTSKLMPKVSSFHAQ